MADDLDPCRSDGFKLPECAVFIAIAAVLINGGVFIREISVEVHKVIPQVGGEIRTEGPAAVALVADTVPLARADKADTRQRKPRRLTARAKEPPADLGGPDAVARIRRTDKQDDLLPVRRDGGHHHIQKAGRLIEDLPLIIVQAHGQGMDAEILLGRHKIVLARKALSAVLPVGIGKLKVVGVDRDAVDEPAIEKLKRLAHHRIILLRKV